MAKAMEFHPARPTLRDFLPIAFLSLLFIILAPRIIADPAPWPLVGMTGTALLIAGGIWLRLMYRFPGHPTLRVDQEGMSYSRGGRQRSLKWIDVSGIIVDFTLNRMQFVSPSVDKPIAMHWNMVSSDGQHWLMVMDNYWKAPKEKGRRRSRT